MRFFEYLTENWGFKSNVLDLLTDFDSDILDRVLDNYASLEFFNAEYQTDFVYDVVFEYISEQYSIYELVYGETNDDIDNEGLDGNYIIQDIDESLCMVILCKESFRTIDPEQEASEEQLQEALDTLNNSLPIKFKFDE
jgi:hypothetical protein